ncbi:hypothetical protein GGQ73_000602 [Rhizobium skierniewicense]|uniref:Uncharacterized protein n=1 Tax=Rhizobium skierniewicense TaxID=984260 RepID=A0A7W6G0G6_9HYPH|nr:hypothetical protein [Rhizobium skierniewicense]MBB3944677.1 hypothetical protein [Rhizobium skierniewicense]
MQERTQDELKIISSMADTMLDLGEGCTEEQLANRFTRAEIKTYSEEARTVAYRKADRIAA